MFNYYFGLALRSLKRNIVLTVLMIAAIGVGIGASMTTLTVFRAMDRRSDPAEIPAAVRGADRQLGTQIQRHHVWRQGSSADTDQLYRRGRPDECARRATAIRDVRDGGGADAVQSGSAAFSSADSRGLHGFFHDVRHALSDGRAMEPGR